MNELWRRIRFLFRRRQFDRDLEEEMRFHLDSMAERRRFALNLGTAGRGARLT